MLYKFSVKCQYSSWEKIQQYFTWYNQEYVKFETADRP